MVEATMDVAPIAGYEPGLGLLLAALEDGTKEWRDELGEIDEDGLVWRPFPEGPSVGAELLHIAEVEAWWMDEVVGGRPLTDAFKARTLSNETQQDIGKWGEAPRMPLAAYFEVMAEVRARTHEVLLNESPDRHLKPDPDRPGMTVRWCLSHVVQHEAYHGGQAVLIKRMHKGGTW